MSKRFWGYVRKENEKGKEKKRGKSEMREGEKRRSVILAGEYGLPP
jgi:hypothetical protein